MGVELAAEERSNGASLEDDVHTASSAPKTSALPERRVRVADVLEGISRRSSVSGGSVCLSPFVGGGF